MLIYRPKINTKLGNKSDSMLAQRYKKFIWNLMSKEVVNFVRSSQFGTKDE